MYQRGGSGIPQQHTGGEASTKSNKSNKSIQSRKSAQNFSQLAVSNQIEFQVSRTDVSLPGPFSVGINQNDRPAQKRDDINQIPNKINSHERPSLPESLGTQDLSQQTSAYSGTFAPSVQPHIEDQNETYLEQNESYLARSALNQHHQLFEQLRSEQAQFAENRHSMGGQKSKNDTFGNQNVLQKQASSQSSGPLPRENVGSFGSLIEVNQQVGIDLTTTETQTRQFTTVPEELSDEQSNTHNEKRMNSMKAIRSPTTETTPTFLLEKEPEINSHDGNGENSGKRLQHNQSGIITEISNSTLEKNGPPIPLDFAMPINKRNNMDRLNSSKNLIHERISERITSEEHQHNTMGSKRTDSADDMTQTISNDSFVSKERRSLMSNDEKGGGGRLAVSALAVTAQDSHSHQGSSGRRNTKAEAPTPTLGPPPTISKIKSNELDRKSPVRGKNYSSNEVVFADKSVKETTIRGDDDTQSCITQSVSNYSIRTPKMANERPKYQNEECTFGRGANLAATIQQTFGRKAELQQKINATFGRGAGLQQQIQQTFGKGTNLQNMIAKELNIKQQLKQVEQQQQQKLTEEAEDPEQTNSSIVESEQPSEIGTTPQTVSSQKYYADNEQLNFAQINQPPKIKKVRKQNTAKNLKKLGLKAGNPSGESVEELTRQTDVNQSVLGKRPKKQDFFKLERSLVMMRRGHNSDDSSSSVRADTKKPLDFVDEIRESAPDHSACFDQVTKKTTESARNCAELLSGGTRTSKNSAYTQLLAVRSLSPTKLKQQYSAVSQYGDMSPSVNSRNVLDFTQPRRRTSARSHEKDKKLADIVDKGRSPDVPFVSGMRQAFKRGTIIKKKTNGARDFNSPPDKYLRKETSSEIDDSSVEEVKSHESHDSNKTRLPEDLIQKYKNFKVNSLKLSVYKDVTLRIFQTINIIKQIEIFPKTPEILKVDFKFKKPGYKKLLIFDLDETLIHTKRDEDDVDDVEFLVQLYGEGFVNLKPDVWVDMIPPDTEDDIVIKSGFFIRPYANECLRAANLDYEVAVFTAGFDWYANPILDHLDPDGTLIQHRFFRQHCQKINHKGREFIIKNLDVFKNISLENVLIVDNQVFSFASHLSNGIPCVDFLGQKGDQELVKVMKYVHEISKEDNLQAANEGMFQLNKILESPIDKFIQYYSIDELSESDEEELPSEEEPKDFEDDGMTVMAGQPNRHEKMESQEDFKQGSNTSPRDTYSQFGDSAELAHNQSIGNSGIDEVQTPTDTLIFGNTKLSQSPMRAKTKKEHKMKAMYIVNQMKKRADQKKVKTNSSLGSSESESVDDTDNIVDQQSSGVNAEQNGGHRGQEQSAKGISEDDLQAQDARDIISFSNREKQLEENKGLQLRSSENSNISNRPQNLQNWKDKNSTFGQSLKDMATSPYFKVSQTTQSMKKIHLAETSAQLGGISTMSPTGADSPSYQTPGSQPKSGPLTSMLNLKQSPQTAQANSRVGRPPRPQVNIAVSVGRKSGKNLGLHQQTNKQLAHYDQSQQGINNALSDSKTHSRPETLGNSYEEEESININLGVVGEVSKLDQNSMQSPDGNNVIAIHDTLLKPNNTSVKKYVSKLGQSDLILPGAEQQQHFHSQKQSILEQPYREMPNFTNILKPPNWTKRKQNLMQRFNSSASPSCASNIDYHLDKLANCYKKSQGELMDILVKQNPENKRFTTNQKVASEQKSRSSEIQSKFSLAMNQTTRHNQGAKIMTANIQPSGRMGIGEGIKRMTEKFQAGQGNGVQMVNIRREVEEKKGSSSVTGKMPEKKKNPKVLKNSCTFGSGEEMQPHIQQQSDESKPMTKHQTEPIDLLQVMKQIQSELTFQPVSGDQNNSNSARNTHKVMTTSSSMLSPLPIENLVSFGPPLKTVVQIPSKEESSNNSRSETERQRQSQRQVRENKEKAPNVPKESRKSPATNQQAGQNKPRRKTKVEIKLAPLADYVNNSRQSKQSSNIMDSSLE